MDGLVAPHIDFHRGGPAYAWAYRALAEAPAADCFVLLGTAHAGLDGHAFAATAKAFETPFGPLEIDREVLDAIARRAPPELFAAELAHRSEHSIEFQAVWLQYLRRRRGGGAPRIVPLLASFAHECLVRRKSPALEREVEAVLDAVRDAMATVPRRYCIVAGADLAHVGPRFGDERPIGHAEAARVQADDHALLEPVVLNDAEAFFAEATRQQDRNRICGLSPIYALLRLLPRGPGAPPQLRPVARSGGDGHLRQRELRGGGTRRMTAAGTEPTGDPALSGAFRIDRDGVWRHEGVEVTHPGVLRNLYLNLREDSEGYHLQAGPMRVPVEVEDAPFIVVRAAARVRPGDPGGAPERREPGEDRRRHPGPGPARHPVLPGQGRAVPSATLRLGLAPARRPGGS